MYGDEEMIKCKEILLRYYTSEDLNVLNDKDLNDKSVQDPVVI